MFLKAVFPGVPVVSMSCVLGDASALLAELAALLGPVSGDGGAPLLTRPRHRAHIEKV